MVGPGENTEHRWQSETSCILKGFRGDLLPVLSKIVFGWAMSKGIVHFYRSYIHLDISGKDAAEILDCLLRWVFSLAGPVSRIFYAVLRPSISLPLG